MLSEHGIDVAAPESEEAKYNLLLTAFGFWDLPVRSFEQAFYGRVPAWDEQSSLERALVELLDQKDNAPTPEQRLHLEEGMRAAVRAHTDPA